MKIDSSSASLTNLDANPIAKKVSVRDEASSRDSARVLTRSDAEVFPPAARDHSAIISRSNAEVFPPVARDLVERPATQVTSVRDAILAAS